MRSERGLQAAVGVVLAFTLLWTIAILIPDPGASRDAAPQGLVVNGTRYVLDSNNVGQAATGSNVHIIHSYASSATAQKVSGIHCFFATESITLHISRLQQSLFHARRRSNARQQTRNEGSSRSRL